MTIEIKFKPGTKVVILDLDSTKAVVRQVCVSEVGATYQVYWFHEGEHRSGWVFEDDIVERRA